MTQEIPFYFDYISHNAYIAWTQLSKLTEKHNITFKPIPVLFGAMLKHNGTLGPAEVPPKANWMTKDVIRKAKRLGVPLVPPYSHPFNPLTALRATCAVPADSDPVPLIDALFVAAWAESRDITNPDVIVDVATAAGYNGKKLVEETLNPEVKKILIENVSGALEKGVFGVPSMLVGDELFWGYDDFPHFELAVAGEDPFDPAEFEAWKQVKPSVQRKK
ncbi:MAG: 2-hydroxychromene-2-carboxylate isomerase [Chloroflexota bacterium]